tara:strand:- start:810 stop:1151 length:342 start_codon:yes stop_codon:yes gene_type:complete
MYIKNLFFKFWYGNLPLWKSYWIVGELINSFVILLIFNLEIKFFNKNLLLYKLPFYSFNNFHHINKILIFVWTLLITIGIWRSAEKYKGKIIWIVLALIFLSYRIFTLRLLLF